VAPKYLKFRSKYDSLYANFTPTLAYLWYLVVFVLETVVPRREIFARLAREVPVTRSPFFQSRRVSISKLRLAHK
jgi:hypothetical protein